MSTARSEVEIRVPTYKRPRLLKRALDSLLAQTHTDWHCIVLDDSPQQEGFPVCASLHDRRICYEPNRGNLGICKNIDLAFSRIPSDETEFLCVLEDDNYFLAQNLAVNINTLEQSGFDILLRNQRIEQMTAHDEPGCLTGRTTFQGQYRNGQLAHAHLWSSFFYSSGANNSSLFWRAGRNLNFSTLAYADDPVTQERLRTLCIDRDVFVGLDPLIVWRDNGDESLRPSLAGLEWRVSQIAAAADERAIYKALYHYLSEKGKYDLAFTPPEGHFTEDRERVFWRVGLPVRPNARHLSGRERNKLHWKRLLASCAALVLSKRRHLNISTTRRRLTVCPKGDLLL